MGDGKHVIIIGGGVAGLTAAAELRAGKVTLIEAKERFGGRVQTLRDGILPIDVGAEFVHGQSKALLDALHEAGSKLIPASERNQMFEEGVLRSVDVWDQFEKLTEAIDPQESDQPFASFLHRQNLDPRTCRMMLGFVTGFNAAHAERISTHSLLRAQYSADQMGGDQQSFAAEGYGPLIDHMVARAEQAGATLLHHAPVRRVRWSAGKVEIDLERDGSIQRLQGDAAVVTVPLGVLKARTIEFEPTLIDKEEAISGMEFGNVIKIKLLFRRPWWPEDPNFGFIHSLDEPLKTWWSDPRGPILTGWAGGPGAELLLKHTKPELENTAIKSLCDVFGVMPDTVRRELVSTHFHNWTEDPHVRGAYSYIPVNGLFLPKLLGAPVEQTLFFAGEATAQDAQMGTVFAALESGQRVAREWNEAFSWR